MARRARPPVSRQSAFWDSSALVPLCITQPASSRVAPYWKRFNPIVWWGTAIEIESALARLLRMNQISATEHAKATRMFKALEEDWTVVQPGEPLSFTARQAVRNYDLTAADALQLAASLAWCEGSPQGRLFMTCDVRLRNAALLAGFNAPAL